jgi:hypothetical protein
MRQKFVCKIPIGLAKDPRQLRRFIIVYLGFILNTSILDQVGLELFVQRNNCIVKFVKKNRRIALDRKTFVNLGSSL